MSADSNFLRETAAEMERFGSLAFGGMSWWADRSRRLRDIAERLQQLEAQREAQLSAIAHSSPHIPGPDCDG